MKKIKITEFADPVCTWCWGSSPIMRALEYRYGEQIEIEYCMVGMIEDISTFNNRRLEIGGENIELSNRNILAHWLEASNTHGMPVEEHNFHLFNSKHRSTIPHCKAYIAAKHCCPRRADGTTDLTQANKYLRRIQEATAAEAMHTADPEVLIDLSAVCGFKPADIKKAMESNNVNNEFKKDREKAAGYEIDTTPSYILKYEGNEAFIRGFSSYETIENYMMSISSGSIRPITVDKEGRERLSVTRDNILHFINKYGSVYPIEIATTFRMKRHSGHSALNFESFELLPDIIEELVKSKKIAITPVANSFRVFSIDKKLNETREKEREFIETF